jgi:hypothetical protein
MTRPPEPSRRTAALAGLLLALAGLLGLAAACHRVDAPPPGVFRDATDEAGLDFVHDHGGTGEFYFPEIMGPGGALFDYDGDGDLDLYCVQGGPLGRTAAVPGLGDRLYRNDLDPKTGRLRFTDVTEASGIRSRGYGMGVAAADVDNDGRVDLYVTRFGSNQLWRNRGDGRFEDVTAAAGADEPRWSTSAAFLDYDRDGWLDLFVTNYVDFRIASHRACQASTGRRDYCAPTVYRGEPDRLLHNRGDGRFEDVTGAAGILSAYGNGLGVVTADFDGDGWIDLYVANDRQHNRLWRNRGDGRFEDTALLAGVAVNMEGQPEASMGVDAGDIDNDGDEDLFMTHLTGETNTLYLNRGDGSFDDRTNALRLGLVSLRFTGFGTAFLDYDRDGWLDIVSANGAVAVTDEQVLAQHVGYGQTDQLFRNRGDGSFEDRTAEAGPSFAVARMSRGTAVGDVDNDGDPDLVVFNTHGPARLLLGQGDASARWIGLRLLSADSRDALGARVELRLDDGRSLWRRVRSDASYLSANDPRLLLGLGASAGALELRVHWPDGQLEAWPAPPAGRYTTLIQGRAP